MASSVKAIPDGYHSVTAYLSIKPRLFIVAVADVFT